MRVVIGAGQTKYEGWYCTQESELDLRDPDAFRRVMPAEGVDAFLAEHVWEHLTYEEGIAAAKNCYAALKPGGYIRAAVPDGNFRNQRYQKLIQVGGPGPRDHPAASHKVVYDFVRFARVFETAGFRVRLLEYCDSNGDFHFGYWNPEDGLVGRSYRFDTRNNDEALGMVSIILDAVKEMIVRRPD